MSRDHSRPTRESRAPHDVESIFELSRASRSSLDNLARLVAIEGCAARRGRLDATSASE
jgi:hypothetical protein